MNCQHGVQAEHSPTATFSPHLLKALAEDGGTKEGPLCPPPAGQHRPGVAHPLTSSLIASQLSSGGVRGIIERFELEVTSKTTNFQHNRLLHFSPTSQKPFSSPKPSPTKPISQL